MTAVAAPSLRCPILLSHDDVTVPLSATSLVQLALNSSHLPLTFTDIDGRFHFTVDYEHNNALLSSSALRQPSTSALNANCHFTGAELAGRAHSSLSACSVSGISAILRTPSNLFILNVDPDGRFSLLPQHIQSCDIVVPRRERRSVMERNPPYYATYASSLQKLRFVEFAFVADYSIFEKYGSDAKAANDRLHTLANMLNSYYKPLNIEIRLVYTEVWSDADKIAVKSESSDGTLDEFLKYRKTFQREHPNDNAHMLTNVRFSSVIGKAFKGTMCSFDYSGGINVDHDKNAALVASTIAHEMGHNFGMDHDVDYSETCKCPAQKGQTAHCIMAASAGYSPPSHWSSCSLEYLATSLGRGVDLCLLNEPDQKGGSAVCGNGIIEAGEDCDCGQGGCTHDCCDAKECRLTEKARCAAGQCCDLSTCQPKERATPCRSATNVCDLAEFCNGETAECPADFYVQDGAVCPGHEEGFCSNGECGSGRDEQCRALWGASGRAAPEECYAANTKGSIYWNCGYDPLSKNYSICAQEDLLCGRLHCETDAERPVIGDASSVTVANSFVYRGDRTAHAACYVVQTLYDTSGQRRGAPGMTLDGTKCGDSRVCLKSKCVPLSDITKTTSKCEDDCNGKGICNNVGNCHCVNGYGGVSCNIPGLGGSVNSNPANFSRGSDVVVIALVFLSLCVGAFAVATWHWRKKGKGFLPAIIWRELKERLRLRGILVPTRKAPAPPSGSRRMTKAKKDSLNAAWGDSPDAAPVVTYSAAPPRILAPSSMTSSPASSPDPLLGGACAHPVASSTIGFKSVPLAPVLPPPAAASVTLQRSPTLPRPSVAPPAAPTRPIESAIVQLYAEHGNELGIRSEAPPPPPKKQAKVSRSESLRPDIKPPPPPHKPKSRVPDDVSVASSTGPSSHEKRAASPDLVSSASADVKSLAAMFNNKK